MNKYLKISIGVTAAAFIASMYYAKNADKDVTGNIRNVSGAVMNIGLTATTYLLLRGKHPVIANIILVAGLGTTVLLYNMSNATGIYKKK